MKQSAIDQDLVRTADSITKLGPEFRGKVLVAGSHGGRYCGYLTALAGLRGVVLNDAGVGCDDAGIGALSYLEPLGIAAAAISHESARIGDGEDMMARGRLSHLNAPARRLGAREGMPCEDAAARFAAGAPVEVDAPPYDEARTVIAHAPMRIIACDSASLVRDEDAGAFIITGSHGGLLAGRPTYGIAAPALGAVYNDAGLGIDRAGVARLRVLDQAGIPAATVSAASARIGDAMSAWHQGVISHVNAAAERLGIAPGWRVPAFADRIAAHTNNPTTD